MTHRRSERGVALIICLFALMLLSGIGLGMMYMADTESSINRNYRDAQQAYFAATAGLQEVRQSLMPGSTFPAPTTLPNLGITTGVVYVRNWGNGVAKTDILPWTSGNAYFDDEFCHENFGAILSPLVGNTGANTPCLYVPSGTPAYVDGTMPGVLGTSANLPYRWVRVTLKANRSSVPDPAATPTNSFYVGSSLDDNTVPICWNGTAEVPKPFGYGTCDDNPPPGGVNYLKSVYVLTALAVTQNGSRRMVQMEVANNPPFLSNAALDTDDFVNTSGSSVTVNGFDNCKCSCTTAVGAPAPTCTDRTTHAACTGSTYAIFSSQTVTTSGNPALIAGTNPAVAQNQPFPFDVPALINRYSTMTGAVNATGSPYNLTCTPQTPPAPANCGVVGGSGTTFGTLPNPFPPTDPSNPVGAVDQITYIPGTVDLQSTRVTGSGVLVVDGNLTLHGGFQFYGLILVRGVLTLSGSGQGQGLNIIGSVVSGQGSVADTISGGVNLQYDRCALLHSQTPQPPALLATHEVSY